jgi:hypothetical protein
MRIGLVWRWAWLVIGAAVFAYSIWTGGGPAGMFMAWQLEKFKTIDPGYTYLLLLLVLVVAPIVTFFPSRRTYQRRPWRPPEQIELGMKRAGRLMLAAGITLWAAVGGALWYTLLLPDLTGKPAIIKLDALPDSAPVREGNTILIGTPQRKFEIRFKESVSNSRWSSTTSGMRFLPMTPSGWKPGQPVRFLLDTGGPWRDELSPVAGDYGDGPAPSKTSAGLLLKNSVPPYLRTVIRRRGLILTDDAMVHTGDPDAGRMSYEVFAGLGGFIGLLLIVFGVLFIYKCDLDRRRGVWPP